MKQNEISDLTTLTSFYRYENFLNVYKDNDNNYFYNLLASINVFPAQDSSVEESYITTFNDTWYLISYKYYGTMDLWWLVCEYNQIKDATQRPQVGTTLKLLKSEYVYLIVQQLNLQINS
jgi:nucleoid-associated protein YgaU